MQFTRIFPLAIVAAITGLQPVETRADAAAAFSTLNGSWSGSGQMRLEGGRTENLRCRASYIDRNRGKGLGISIRCASAASKVDLRASLTAQGSRLSGNWEEREFNVGGSAQGATNANTIALSINGGIEGSMTVVTNGGRQSINITTDNVALKGIRIGLSRE